jgi:hypothetical protein
MGRSRSWIIYQVLLFFAVWVGWYYICAYIDADDGGRIYAPRTDTNTYVIGLLPALLIWWALATHRRTTLIVAGIGIGSIGSAAVLGMIWLFVSENFLRSYGVVLAFPMVILWVFLLRWIWNFVHKRAPDE